MTSQATFDGWSTFLVCLAVVGTALYVRLNRGTGRPRISNSTHAEDTRAAAELYRRMTVGVTALNVSVVKEARKGHVSIPLLEPVVVVSQYLHSGNDLILRSSEDIDDLITRLGNARERAWPKDKR